MRQSLSLSRPATVKLLHITLRTLHNWETGKVRIPYAAFKLIRLFNSYEIFRPIWQDWRIVGSRLVTPEGHALEAGNFHWLSLMARRSDAFGRLHREKRTQKVEQAEMSASASGLVYTSNRTIFSNHSKLGHTPPNLLWVGSPPPSNTGGKTSLAGGKAEQEHGHGTPETALFHPQKHRSIYQQLSTGGAL